MSKKKKAFIAHKRTISGRVEQSSSGRQGVTRVLLIMVVTAFGLIAITTVLNARTPAVPVSVGTANPSNEEDFPSQGQTHIGQGESHPPYNSNPPTSGWHYDTPADWGIYTQALPDEVVVHNLEHGGIWLSYRDAGDEHTIQQLEAIARQFPDHVILTYRPTDDKPIAVAAWGHLLKLDAADSNSILDFINRYIRKGPENV